MQLRILKGYQAGTQLELQKKVFSVGREPDNDFVVPDPEISRHHCIITNLDQNWTVQDLQSRNGVAVNGKKIDEKQVLKEGDEITLYHLVMKFEDETKPREAIPLFPETTEDKDADKPNSEPKSPLFTIPELREEPEQITENGRLPNPLELIVPIAKGATLIVIIAAIAVLIYLLTTGNKEDTEQTDETPTEQVADEAKPEAEAEATAATQTPKQETPKTERHARGEELLEDKDKILELDVANAVPPPPPATQQPSQQQPTIPQTQEDDGEPTLVPVKNKTVIVKSSPSGANVAVNGQFLQQTPAVLQDLEEEQVSLELELPGYEPKTILVNVADGLSLEPVTLVQKVGTLLVESTPPGALVMEGRIIYGTTPILIQNLKPGTHNLLLERKDCTPQPLTVNMTDAKGEKVSATLKQNLGNLEITSIPPKCSIFLDGLHVGNTEPDGESMRSKPLRVEKLSPGQCTIKILHPGTGTFDTITGAIPNSGTAKYRAFIWIPTHRIILANNTTTVGMIRQKNQDAITILTMDNKQKTIPTKDYTKLVTLTPDEQNHILKMRAQGAPSGQLSTKSKLSIRAEDFLKQANFPAFRGYVKSKLCITGYVTMRMKTPKGTVVHFGKQIRCILAPTSSKDDYKKIGRLEDAGKAVSLRGTYEGDVNDVYVFTNCVLLPYPD